MKRIIFLIITMMLFFNCLAQNGTNQAIAIEDQFNEDAQTTIHILSERIFEVGYYYGVTLLKYNNPQKVLGIQIIESDTNPLHMRMQMAYQEILKKSKLQPILDSISTNDEIEGELIKFCEYVKAAVANNTPTSTPLPLLYRIFTGGVAMGSVHATTIRLQHSELDPLSSDFDYFNGDQQKMVNRINQLLYTDIIGDIKLQ